MVGTAGGLPWRVTSGNHSSQSTGSGTPAVGWRDPGFAEETHGLRPQFIPPPPFGRPRGETKYSVPFVRVSTVFPPNKQ